MVWRVLLTYIPGFSATYVIYGFLGVVNMQIKPDLIDVHL
jgi:hypothetical protein